MKCKIEKTTLSGTIHCPANKSYTHRAVFLASLAGQPSVIRNVLYSEDTEATISTCESFGAGIERDGTTLRITQKIGIKKTNLKINAANSGTTIRIAAAIASLFESTTTLTGDESLKKRPMQYLINCLEQMGAKCKSDEGKPPLEITGKITGGEISIPGNVSSQFISALFIIGPLTQNGITLNIHDDLVSKPYVDATIASMKKFGAEVRVIEQYRRYNIPTQVYVPTTFEVPSDFSSLALLLSASVLIGKEFEIKVNIDDLPQGDKHFLDILKELGVKINFKDNIISLDVPNKLKGGRFDLSNTPDLLPPLSILVIKSEKPIEIFNVKHARFKETDRIALISREMKKIGLIVNEREDGLILSPVENYNGAEFDSEKDHRLFMAFCIAGMCIGNCTVTDPESVSVSYPKFIEDLNSIGGKIIKQER